MKVAIVSLVFLLIACSTSTVPATPMVENTPLDSSERTADTTLVPQQPVPEPATVQQPANQEPVAATKIKPTIPAFPTGAISSVPVSEPVPVATEPTEVQLTALQEYALWCGEHSERWDPVFEKMESWGDAAAAYKKSSAEWEMGDPPDEVKNFHTINSETLERLLEFAEDQKPEDEFAPFMALLHEPIMIAAVASGEAERALSDETRKELEGTGCLSSEEEINREPDPTATPVPEKWESIVYLDPLTDEVTVSLTLKANGRYYLVLESSCKGSIALYFDANVWSWSTGEQQELLLRFGDSDHLTEEWTWVSKGSALPGYLTESLLQPPAGKLDSYVSRILLDEKVVVRYPEGSGISEFTAVFEAEGAKTTVERALLENCS